MAFLHDAPFANDVPGAYGEYLSTFESEKRQVRADIFRKGESLVAHVSFPTGSSATKVTDSYLSALQKFAAERGFDGKLRLIYS